MYPVKVTYEGFDGETIEETLYFHMATKDWVKADEDKREFGGYEKYLANQLDATGTEPITPENLNPENIRPARVLGLLEDLIRRSYGERSEDGRRFIKDPERTERFMESFAYDAFLDDLLYKDGLSMAFIQALVPKAGLKKTDAQDHA